MMSQTTIRQAPEVTLLALGKLLDEMDGEMLEFEPEAYRAAYSQAREIVSERRTPEVLALLRRPECALDDINIDFLDDEAGLKTTRRRDPETGRMRGRG